MKSTLVFLHYYSGAATSWQYVAEALANDYRCIAIDLPGFGGCPMIDSPSIRSYSDWVWNFLQNGGVCSFSLIGHSMGGKIAMDMAAMQSLGLSPDTLQITSLGLLAPSPATVEPMDASEKDELQSSHPDREAARQMVTDSTIADLNEQRIQIAIDTNLQSHENAWRWWLRKGMNESIATQVEHIDVPTSVLASMDDPVIPMEAIQKNVVELIPNSTLNRVSGVGHLMPLEDEHLVGNWIRKHIFPT